MQNKADFEEYLTLPKKQQEYIKIKAETGKKDKDIAKEISTNATTLTRWKKRADFQAGMRGFQANYLEKAVPKAMSTMIDLLDARSELVKFQASKDIMDRTGYYVVEKTEQEITQRNIDINIGEYDDDSDN